MNKKICGVVILYNPDVDVWTNIQSYCGKIEKLYIVDNSEKKNDKLLTKLKLLSNVEYIDLLENVGIAKALNHVASMAIQNSFDFMLTMDQDSRFEEGHFNLLFEYMLSNDLDSVGIVSALQSSYLQKNTLEMLESEPFTVITSGNMVNLKIYQELGSFNEDYFIDAIDWDYSLKIQRHSYKIIRLNNVLLKHNLGEMTEHKSLFGKPVVTYNHNKIRRYYMMRNRLDMIIRNILKYPRFSLSTLKTLWIDFKNILLYEDDKGAKLYYSYLGFIDFILRRFGRKND